MRRIDNLQTLRAFAAINVVLYHIIGTGRSYYAIPDILRILDKWGACGVDVFFVISGFVMLHAQLKQRKGILMFYVSRIIRIVPIYWILTSLLLVLYYLYSGMFRSINVTEYKIVASYLFLSMVLVGKSPLLHVGWTLEWEMFFYLVFGFGLLLGGVWKLFVSTSVIVLIVALFLGDYVALEFLLGMIVALVYYYLTIGDKVAYFALFLGVVLLASSINNTIFELGIDRLLIWGVPSFFLVLGAVHVRQLDLSGLIYLGDASYSIYLVQVFTVPFFYKTVKHAGVAFNADYLAMLCLLFSVIIGCFTYSFIERPVSAYLRRKVLL